MEIGRWESFFFAEVGAAAALTGLVFVAVSINLTKIIAGGGLINRALVALMLLVGNLLEASLPLIPDQRPALLGAEILAIASLVWIVGTTMNIRALRTAERAFRRVFVVNILFFQAAILPFLVGGGLVAFGNTSGLGWMAAAILLSFAKAVMDSWVLLVEINR